VTVVYAHDDTALYTFAVLAPVTSAAEGTSGGSALPSLAPPKKLGTFDCLGGDGARSMTDLAIDAQGRIVGVAKGHVFPNVTVPPAGQGSAGEGAPGSEGAAAVVRCRDGAKELVFPDGADDRQSVFGASFAPCGTVREDKEALVVGTTAGNLYEVDLVTGKLSLLGTLGVVPQNDGSGHNYPRAHVGKAWELSGDIVFV
jgi:hypothetical protein